jgi:hypothetical protein
MLSQIFDALTLTCSRFIRAALRILVSISAIVSLLLISLHLDRPLLRFCEAKRRGLYQLAFLTPGIFPSLANFLKQIRQILNLRYTALDLPQSWQRVYCLTRNFGFIFCLFSRALVDIQILQFYPPT